MALDDLIRDDERYGGQSLSTDLSAVVSNVELGGISMS
jgi:hypothetical protein